MSNLKISERFTVDAPIETVWSFLIDPVQVAACLPGAKLDGREGADTYLGVMKLKVGPVSTEFRGKATLSEVNVGERTLLLTGTGEDKGGGSSARLTMRCGVQPAAAGGADVSVDADVEMAGKLVRFGRGMIEGVSKQLFKQFVERARTRLAAAGKGEAPVAAAAELATTPDQSAAAAPAAAAASLADGIVQAEQIAPPATGESAGKIEPPTPLVQSSSLAAAASPPLAASHDGAAEPSAPLAASHDGAAESSAPLAASHDGAAEPSAPLETLTTPSRVGAAPAPPTPPPAGTALSSGPDNEEALDGGALLWQAFKEWLIGWFRRVFRRPNR